MFVCQGFDVKLKCGITSIWDKVCGPAGLKQVNTHLFEVLIDLEVVERLFHKG